MTIRVLVIVEVIGLLAVAVALLVAADVVVTVLVIVGVPCILFPSIAEERARRLDARQEVGL